jgi:hypothetical protein
MHMGPMRLLGFLFPLSLALVSSAYAAPVQTPHVEAELVSAVRSIEPGKPFTVALRLQHDEYWHTYWKNPGDSGMATAIEWTLPEGFSAGPIQWPTPQRIPIPPLANFGYEEIPADGYPGACRPGAEPRRSSGQGRVAGLQRHLLARRRPSAFPCQSQPAQRRATGAGPLLARARSEAPRQLNG